MSEIGKRIDHVIRVGLAPVLREAGFTRVRRAAETPFNLVLELRK